MDINVEGFFLWLANPLIFKVVLAVALDYSIISITNLNSWKKAAYMRFQSLEFLSFENSADATSCNFWLKHVRNFKSNIPTNKNVKVI